MLLSRKSNQSYQDQRAEKVCQSREADGNESKPANEFSTRTSVIMSLKKQQQSKNWQIHNHRLTLLQSKSRGNKCPLETTSIPVTSN
jgi:hypothetical protein